MAKAVLIDLAGVVYQGDRLIPGSAEAVEQLRASGLPVRFVTNSTRSSRRQIVAQLVAMGIAPRENELFTPAEMACAWLAREGRSPHLLVAPELEEDFAACSAGNPPAVVVGDAGTGFTYEAMNAAFRRLADGAPLLALAPNRTFRDSDGGLSLDAGPFVAALEFAAGTQALVLGKPSSAFFELAVNSAGCGLSEAVMVGDDAEADVAGALAAGMSRAVLVRTGKYRAGDESRFHPAPSHVADDLAAAAAWIMDGRVQAARQSGY